MYRVTNRIVLIRLLVMVLFSGCVGPVLAENARTPQAGDNSSSSARDAPYSRIRQAELLRRQQQTKLKEKHGPTGSIGAELFNFSAKVDTCSKPSGINKSRIFSLFCNPNSEIQGVVVGRLAKQGAFYKAGIRTGDVLQRVQYGVRRRV
jgi:hypothetical protein